MRIYHATGDLSNAKSLFQRLHLLSVFKQSRVHVLLGTSIIIINMTTTAQTAPNAPPRTTSSNAPTITITRPSISDASPGQQDSIGQLKLLERSSSKKGYFQERKDRHEKRNTKGSEIKSAPRSSSVPVFAPGRFTTVPTYMRHCRGWEDKLLEHPALYFMTAQRQALDEGMMKDKPYTWFLTPDFTLTLTDGSTMPAGTASWDALLDRYKPFDRHFHEIRSVCVYETKGGYEMWAVVHVFANLIVKGKLERRMKVDMGGRRWDVVSPSMFLYTIKEDSSGPRGFKISTMKMYGDGIPVLGEMIQRGMVRTEDMK
jgi:hypothetical protein